MSFFSFSIFEMLITILGCIFSARVEPKVEETTVRKPQRDSPEQRRNFYDKNSTITLGRWSYFYVKSLLENLA